MSAAEIVLSIFVTYLIIENALDFFIPGRWQKRAYKQSLKDLEKYFSDKNK